jgi:hypothetical protein
LPSTAIDSSMLRPPAAMCESTRSTHHRTCAGSLRRGVSSVRPNLPRVAPLRVRYDRRLHHRLDLTQLRNTA